MSQSPSSQPLGGINHISGCIGYPNSPQRFAESSNHPRDPSSSHWTGRFPDYVVLDGFQTDTIVDVEQGAIIHAEYIDTMVPLKKRIEVSSEGMKDARSPPVSEQSPMKRGVPEPG